VLYEKATCVDEVRIEKDACKKRAITGGFKGMMVSFLKAFHAFHRGDSGE
jgi:hypothetical protein